MLIVIPRTATDKIIFLEKEMKQEDLNGMLDDTI